AERSWGTNCARALRVRPAAPPGRYCVRDRLVVPILIPVGAALTIVLLIVSGSKILLDIDPAFATVCAIAAAGSILLISTLMAVGPRLRAAQVYVITALPVSVILAVGLYLVVQPQPKVA